MSKPSPIEFLRDLVSDIPFVYESLDNSLRRWGSEDPPATFVFGDVGDAIAANLGVLPAESRSKLFAGIEQAMASEDVALRTAMATGLVEALVGAADKRPTLWADFKAMFGPATMKHAVAWRDFGR